MKGKKRKHVKSARAVGTPTCDASKQGNMTAKELCTPSPGGSTGGQMASTGGQMATSLNIGGGSPVYRKRVSNAMGKPTLKQLEIQLQNLLSQLATLENQYKTAPNNALAVEINVLEQQVTLIESEIKGLKSKAALPTVLTSNATGTQDYQTQIDNWNGQITDAQNAIIADQAVVTWGTTHPCYSAVQNVLSNWGHCVGDDGGTSAATLSSIKKASFSNADLKTIGILAATGPLGISAAEIAVAVDLFKKKTTQSQAQKFAGGWAAFSAFGVLAIGTDTTYCGWDVVTADGGGSFCGSDMTVYTSGAAARQGDCNLLASIQAHIVAAQADIAQQNAIIAQLNTNIANAQAMLDKAEQASAQAASTVVVAQGQSIEEQGAGQAQVLQGQAAVDTATGSTQTSTVMYIVIGAIVIAGIIYYFKGNKAA